MGRVWNEFSSNHSNLKLTRFNRRLQQGAVAEPPAKCPSGQAAHPQCPSTCPDLPGLPGYKLLQEFTVQNTKCIKMITMFQGGTTAQLTTWPTATSLAPVLLSII